MKLAWISHSLINPRQHRFVEFLEDEYGVDVLQVYPERWGPERREGGYQVYGEGMANFVFEPNAFSDISDFKPDVVYLQQELWSKVSLQVATFCARMSVPLVVFVWENKRELIGRERTVLNSVDTVVCGNREAEERLPEGTDTVVIPQVGIDTELFCPGDKDSEKDLVFPARPSEEKGWKVLQDAVEGTDLNVHRPWEEGRGRIEYGDMVDEYRCGDVCVAPSIETDDWMEQFNYSIGEALATGLSAVISDCGSMPGVWGECSAVEVVPENDVEALREAVLDPPSPDGGRQFVKNNYSYGAVGEKIMDVFKKINDEV